jgi:hypothetical protein
VAEDENEEEEEVDEGKILLTDVSVFCIFSAYFIQEFVCGLIFI